MSSFAKDRDATLAGHPTPKPLALVSDAILDCSKRGGIVLDAFAGSGTTLLAAEKPAGSATASSSICIMPISSLSDSRRSMA
jgi:hypothetical protein